MGDIATLRSQINQWTLDQDNRTYTKMDQMSSSLLTKLGAVSSDIRSVQHSANSIHAQINQVFNKFLNLSDNRFTEHRMAPPQEVPQKAPPPANKDDGLTIPQKYTKALGIALQTLDLQQMAADDDIFDDRDDKSISVFSAATTSGTVSKSVKLPAMYGTPLFASNKFIGLFDDFDEAPPEPVRQSQQAPPAYRQSEPVQQLQQTQFNQQGQHNQSLNQPIRQSIKGEQSMLSDYDNNQFITRTNSQLGNSTIEEFKPFQNTQQQQDFYKEFAPSSQPQQQQQPGQLMAPIPTAAQTQRPTVVDAPQQPYQQEIYQQQLPVQPQLPPPTQPPPVQQPPQSLQDQLNQLMSQKREQQSQQQPQQLITEPDRFSFQQPPQRPSQQPQKQFQPPTVIGAPAYAQQKDKIMNLFVGDDDDEDDNSLFKSVSNNKNKFNTLLTDGVATTTAEPLKPVTVVVEEEVEPKQLSVYRAQQNKLLFEDTEEEGKLKANADKIAAIYAKPVQPVQPVQTAQPQQQKPAAPKKQNNNNIFGDSDEDKKKPALFQPIKKEEVVVVIKTTQQEVKSIQPQTLAVPVDEAPPNRTSIQQLQNRLNLNMGMFMKPPGEQLTITKIKEESTKEQESDFIEQQAERPMIQKKKPRARQAIKFEDDQEQQSKKPTFVIAEKTTQAVKAESVIDRQSYRESIKLNKQDFNVPIILEKEKPEVKQEQIPAVVPNQGSQLPKLTKPQDPLSKKTIAKEFEDKGLPNFFNDPLGGGSKKPVQQVQIGNLPTLGSKSTQQQQQPAAMTPTIAKPQRKQMFSDEEESLQLGKPVQQKVEPQKPMQPVAQAKPGIKKNMFDDSDEEDFKPPVKPVQQQQQPVQQPVREAPKKPEPPKQAARPAAQSRNQRAQKALFDDSD